MDSIFSVPGEYTIYEGTKLSGIYIIILWIFVGFRCAFNRILLDFWPDLYTLLYFLL